ncbi:MAG: hypothetical protein JNK02_15760 [Planctomycetes bacterium]|nr:hypothetical protein [Planctomycetota bacterium]
MKLPRVRRRDGTVADFERRRVEAAVRRAAERAGEEDSRAPGEVADLVEMALGRRYAPERARDTASTAALPSVEEVEDLVEEALVELGHAAVAKAYILDRARDARTRAALGAAHDSALGRRAPRVAVRGGVEPWSRARIVAALVSEADVARELAEEVAARVEERVFASGWRRVSTSLVRELVDNELVERGLSDALSRTRPVGVPRHDLVRWIATPEPEREPGASDPRGLAGRIAGEVLRRHVLEDVLPDALVDALSDGDFGIEDLERAHQDLVLAVPCELLAAGELDGAQAFEVLAEVAALGSRVSRRIVLEDANDLLAALARAPRGAGSDRLAAWLAALAAVARASGRALDLGLRLKPRERGPAAPAWFERLVAELSAAESGGPRADLPRLLVDAAELVEAGAQDPALERGVELLLARGRLVPVFATAGLRPCGPGLVRGARDHGALALRAVATLNLPRAARRAGPWREDALFEELQRLLSQALDALAALRELRRATPVAGLRARSAHAVVPVGLVEAVRWMHDGAARPEGAARLLSFLAEAAHRLGHERGLLVHVAGDFGARDARRFAARDARRFQTIQNQLFPADDAAPAGPELSHGLDLARLGDPATRAEALGVTLAALDAGLLDAPGLVRALARPADERAPLLAGLAAFVRARERARTRAGVLYVLPRNEGAGTLYSDDAPAIS